MEAIKTNIVVFDTETNMLATIVEYCKANKESSMRIFLKKESEMGINCYQYFTSDKFNKRFIF